MRKDKLIFLLASLTLVLVISLAGCKSEQKTTTPAAASTTTQPAISVSKPAPTTQSPAAATTLPAVTTAPAQTSPASGNKVLQELKAKSEQISGMKFDIVMSNGIMTSKVYQKKHKSRMETNMMGMNMTLITDGDKQIMYTWMVDQNQATKTDLTKEKPITAQANVQDFWDSDLVVKGNETLDGKTCTIVEYDKTTEEGKMTGKVWIWQEKAVPLRMDTTMSSTTEKLMNMTVTIEFKNYEFVELEDSLFELPAEVDIVEKLDFFPSAMPSDPPTGLPNNLPK